MKVMRDYLMVLMFQLKLHLQLMLNKYLNHLLIDLVYLNNVEWSFDLIYFLIDDLMRLYLRDNLDELLMYFEEDHCHYLYQLLFQVLKNIMTFIKYSEKNNFTIRINFIVIIGRLF